jgi:LuxR family transcriptional regulator, regulator of acetate metabolism
VSAPIRHTPERLVLESGGAAALVGVAPALRSLRRATSPEALFRHATSALCDEVGFGRAALFSLRDHALVAESVQASGTPDEGDRLLETLREATVPLGPGLHESEVLRRRTALLVKDAGDRHALAMLPGTHSYVAAPVIREEQAVALIHADYGPCGRAVAEFDRAALWAFAEGLGYALERCVLEGRLRGHAERVLALMRSTEASVEELVTPAVAVPRPLQRTSPAPPRLPERERLEMLTRREREVLAMLAEGETNASIAHRLVVSEDTVKTHVKHILRKLAVKNRSQAVSRYFRMRGPGVERGLAAEAGGFG